MPDEPDAPGPPSQPPPPPPDSVPPPAPIPAYVVSSPEWRNLEGLKNVLTLMLGANALAAAFLAIAFANRLSFFSDFERGAFAPFELLNRAQDADDLVHAAAITNIVLFLTTAVLFIIWFFRVAKNTEALGRERPRLGPGWAIGGWFIPLANFVIPVLVAQDLWRGSNPETPRGDPTWRIGARSALVGWWWAMFLISYLNGTADLDDPNTTIDDLKTSDTLSLLGSVFRIAAAVLAILVVRKLTDRQEACLKSQQEAWTRDYGGGPTPGA
jgi:uncharacterized protein DUF4328